MAQSNAAFALLTLGQWSRNHGIYEVRDVLAKANHLAAGAESSEMLAAALEEASIAADVQICPAPAPVKQAASAPAEGEEESLNRLSGARAKGIGAPASAPVTSRRMIPPLRT